METSKYLSYLDDEAFGPEFFREIERMQARWIHESEGNSEEGEDDDLEQVAAEKTDLIQQPSYRGEYTGKRRRTLRH